MTATGANATDHREQARTLLGRMTLTEKVAQLRSIWVNFDHAKGTFFLDPAFAQVVAGGGAVILYITVYAGYALPEYRDALGMSLALVLALANQLQVQRFARQQHGFE